MKIKMMIFAILTAILIFSCTPEIDDDYIRIDFSNLSQFCLYNTDSSDVVLVKVNYQGHPSRNGVFLEDTIHTENVLYFRPDENSNWIYRYTFRPDSDIFAAKREGNDVFFIQNANTDTFYYKINVLTGFAVDTLENIDYISSLSISHTDSLDSLFILNLDNFKPYGQWKDEIINLYR